MIFSALLKNYDIANFADDNTPYVTRDNISSVDKLLKGVACAIFEWFNADKCHVLLSTSNELTVKIDVIQLKNSQLENLLGITTENDLNYLNK